jgi:hypothetical protein
MKRKPQAGVCRVCGCVVLRKPDHEDKRERMADKISDAHWIDGHYYEWDVQNHTHKLMDVRCDKHRDDPWRDMELYG